MNTRIVFYLMLQNSQLSDLIRPSLFLRHPPNQKDDLALIIEDFLELYHHQYIIHALNGRVRKTDPASKRQSSRLDGESYDIILVNDLLILKLLIGLFEDIYLSLQNQI